MRLLVPHEAVPSVFAIDYEQLWKKGIQGLIFDLDNTLCPWRAPSLGKETTELLKRLLKLEFRVCVLSNGNLGAREGILRQFRQLGIPAIYPARKPFPSGFIQALRFLEMSSRQAAVIGDQLLTDILGGNLLGLYTILVDPLNPEEHPWTRWVMRSLERILGRKVIRRSCPAGADRGYPATHLPRDSRPNRKG